MSPQPHQGSEKPALPTQIEDVATPVVSLDDERKQPDQERTGDYSGAVAKTDPREIALVRKLDWRIMPTLFAMYFL